MLLSAEPIKVTLTSETIQRTTQGHCGGLYNFVSLSPAVYEVTAEFLNGQESGYLELFVDKTNLSAAVKLQPPPTVEFDIRRSGSASVVDFPVTVTGRRQDLYDAGAEQTVTDDAAARRMSGGSLGVDRAGGRGQVYRIDFEFPGAGAEGAAEGEIRRVVRHFSGHAEFGARPDHGVGQGRANLRHRAGRRKVKRECPERPCSCGPPAKTRGGR